jgi:rhodanese-related sulfurtransferase
MDTKSGLLILSLVILTCLTVTHCGYSQETKHELPKGKQTVLGLYVTSKEAFEKWQADPEKVKILDVRTPEEYIFVGHPEMAWNIPLAFQTYQWDSLKGRFAIEPNPDFIDQVKYQFTPDDTLLIICRSGGRSAMAVNMLAEKGFKDSYNVTDGMEGDLVKDPDNLFEGKRMKNGWKNSGLPWTYQVNPEKLRLPKQK